jgi:DNA sulfur modification protein DndD
LGDNKFDFKEGLNVVIGDNGSGKSRLYDAFYWVLYDSVFNSTTRDFEKTSHVSVNLISDKAKAEAQVGDYIVVKVELVIEEPIRDSKMVNSYLLKRSIGFEKIKNTDDYNDKSAWKMDGNSITEIEHKDIINFKPMSDPLAFEKISNKLLPRDMEPYLWFQGEQVDSLIDFKEEESLKKAIDILSGINIFDAYIEIAKKVSNQANDAYKKEERDKLKKDEAAQESINKKEQLEKLIDKEENDLIQIQHNLDIAQQHKEELLGKIEDAKELERLKSAINVANSNITRVKNELATARKNFNNNLFEKKWLLRNAGEYTIAFEKKLKTYNEKREELKLSHKLEQQQIEANKHRLPENVPNRQYLEEMLEEKKCFLCNRTFNDGDSAEHYLKDLLEKTKNKKVKYTDFLSQDLNRNLQELYSNAYNLNAYHIPNVDDSIKKEIEKLEVLEEKLAGKIEDLKKLESELNHLLAIGSLSETESLNIVRSFRESDSSNTKFLVNKHQIETRLKQYKEQLQSVNEKLKQYLGKGTKLDTLEKKEVLDDFLNVALSTRNLVYEEQVKRIEKLANNYFHQMTKENKSIQGDIILEKIGRCYMPKNVDSNGVELTLINDSNIILIKLATIMAIVTAKGGTENHPLISDAPTSKFSDNYTLGFCQTISEVFKQSIIISYDFYHNVKLRERLLKEVNGLGAVILIEPTQPENERMNRTKLSTKITTLN